MNSNNVTTASVPRAHIHRAILDAAADDPDASLEAIADEVPSATADLVDRVLAEYGDPADSAPAATAADETAPMTTGASSDGETDSLTEAQEQLLELIRADPTATQRELAEETDVSQATVNTRLADIDGFDWADRASFVDAHVESARSTEASSAAEAATERGAEPGDASVAGDGGAADGDSDGTAQADDAHPPESEEASPTAAESDPGETNGEFDPASVDSPSAPEQTLASLDDRLSRLEERSDAATDGGAALQDPDLRYKVARACFDAEAISEEEERRIFRTLLE